MLDFKDLINQGISEFLASFFNELITKFAETLSDIMGTSLNVLNMPLVQSGIKYAQVLAFVLLVLKSMNEAFQTYILHQNGDPDADPGGLLIRVGQATAIIATLPWIVNQIFTFGTKITADISNLSKGDMGVMDWTALTSLVVGTGGTVIILMCIVIVVCFLIVTIQAAIRGAELALMSVIGPIMALNITANNRSIWSSWFKQVIIICVSQGLQIFMLQGAFALITNEIAEGGLLLVIGWLWVTIKTPKYLQQFAYSTGFTGSIGGTAKQASTLMIMKKMR